MEKKMEGRREAISSLEPRMQLSRVREMRDVGRSPPPHVPI